MKRIFFTTLVSFISCVSMHEEPTPQPNEWQRIGDTHTTGSLAMSQCFTNNGTMMIFGGVRDDDQFSPFNNTAYLYRPLENLWQPLKKGALQPTSHQVLGGYKGEYFVFGGRLQSEELSRDSFRLSPGGQVWRKLSNSPINPRMRHSINLTEDKAIIFGGQSPVHKALNWGYYDYKRNAWFSQVLPPNIENRVSHIAEAIEGRLFIWGGFGNGQKRDNGYLLDVATRRWSQLPKSPLSARTNARSAIIGTKILIWGGSNMEENANTGALFDLETQEWTKVPPIPDRNYRSLKNPTLTYLGNQKVLLWGGRFGTQEFSNQGWVIDVSILRWTRFQQKKAPMGRMLHCLKKVDQVLILMGGIGKSKVGIENMGEVYMFKLPQFYNNLTS